MIVIILAPESSKVLIPLFIKAFCNSYAFNWNICKGQRSPMRSTVKLIIFAIIACHNIIHSVCLTLNVLHSSKTSTIQCE